MGKMNSSVPPTYSLIVPVYERPDEIQELLASLCEQTLKDFEVLVVDDGSKTPCEAIVKNFLDRLEVHYFFKSNSGPGPSRNYGADRASGSWLIFLDSDCVIPPGYLQAVHEGLSDGVLDAFGGPDRAADNFTPIQKAINYAMTGFFTTGGIRGSAKALDKFHPRSFNMGIHREVYQKTKGFAPMRFGEDVDLSLRILSAGFKTGLIPKAWVYHKRRTDFRKFFKQVHNSGIARIHLYKRHPKSLKAVHFFPSLWLLGVTLLLFAGLFIHPLMLMPLVLWGVFILAEAAWQSKSLTVGAISIPASVVQLSGYGLGFIRAFIVRLVLKRGEFSAYEDNFYE
jgi:glycosyltransferase involved in cell wall biosynthesis